MNPFDLTGPEFLIFYLCLSAIVVFAVWMTRRNAESGPTPKINLSDPYLIAFLRGGENEVLRLAVVSLVDRGVLIAEGTTLQRNDEAQNHGAQIRIEQEVLNKFARREEASSIFKDARLKSACQPYRMTLEQAGLLPDAKTKGERWLRFGYAALALAGTSMAKAAIGLSRERPVFFLLMLSGVALIAAAVVSFPRLTTRGQTMLADVKNLYGGLKDRADTMVQGAATSEALMLAAVFGVAALGPSQYAYARTLFPQASSTGGCGSSCGSSCSSSGGDGGGSGGCGGSGCGGCGS